MSLPWLRLIVKEAGRRSFHSSKCRFLFYEAPDKDGYRIKNDELKEWEKLPFKKKLLIEWQLMIEGLKETYSNIIMEAKRGPRVFIPENEVDVIHRFTEDPKELKKWVITTDNDHNMGYSTAKLDLTKGSKGLFHGFLDTKLPPDGKMVRTGFVNLRLVPKLGPFKQKIYFDWSSYTHLVLRIRGDGRVYAINLHLEGDKDVIQYDTYHYFIWTRGGPYWQHIRIPFSKFFFAYRGRIQTTMKPFKVHQDEVGSISVTLADKITGPFHLEIDYVGVERHLSHIEESAYELYHFEQKFY